MNTQEQALSLFSRAVALGINTRILSQEHMHKSAVTRKTLKLNGVRMTASAAKRYILQLENNFNIK